MVVSETNTENIMSGLENAAGVKQHSHKKKLRQRFDIIRKLGQGTFGKVQLGINKETGQEVAIKTIKKSKIVTDADLLRIRREIQIMSSVRHPNIIHIYEVFENREKMVLVMEYAAGGELYDYLSERKVLEENEARRIFRQIATACYYCHKHKICHRDLKLENILLDEDNNAKIADFGLSNVFDNQRLLNTFCGSPLYASPEIVKGTPYQGPEVDCWSLGVLLYTLVYGAMPFDGSNFKRLVKQISQGSYFEPKAPSPASSLIRELLTVDPKERATIERICSHTWVNETYDQGCLAISEELANQTPVRLDLLLSLAPPPPQLESDKLVLDQVGSAANDSALSDMITEPCVVSPDSPSRKPIRISQSAGSLERMRSRSTDTWLPIKEQPEGSFVGEVNAAPIVELSPDIDRSENISTTKSNIEAIASSDILPSTGKKEESVKHDVSKPDVRPEKIFKEHTNSDISGSMELNRAEEPSSSVMSTATTSMTEKKLVPTVQIPEEKRKSEGIPSPSQINQEPTVRKLKPPKVKKSSKEEEITTPVISATNEEPSSCVVLPSSTSTTAAKKKSSLLSPKRKPITERAVNGDSNSTVRKLSSPETKISAVISTSTDSARQDSEKLQMPRRASADSSIGKPASNLASTMERRRSSRIFEVAEKFQNLIANSQSNSTSDNSEHSSASCTADKVSSHKKPPIVIPGVSVDGFKREFERRASLSAPVAKQTTTQTPVVKKTISLDAGRGSTDSSVNAQNDNAEGERDERVRTAVSIISSALERQEDKSLTKKSRSKPTCIRKPPVPFGTAGRSATATINQPPVSHYSIPRPFVRAHTIDTDSPPSVYDEANKVVDTTNSHSLPSMDMGALKSATLPRPNRTARIESPKTQSVSSVPHPSSVIFKTETANKDINNRVVKSPASSSNERIIPIAVEGGGSASDVSAVSSLQQKIEDLRSTPLPAQCTSPKPFDRSICGEPIRKSPREFIIPIAVEGGGYVTPRAGSLEPSDSSTSNTIKSKFGRSRRMNSLLSDRESEDESISTVPLEGNKTHMHRLRSSKPLKRSSLEHNDSLSSGDDEDDDDAFEILTAENLFSTLLSRVRDLTQRLNTEDNKGRPSGFPSTRLLSHFDHGTKFWNLHNRMDPLTRHSSMNRAFSRDRAPPAHHATSSTTSWRRSESKESATSLSENEPNVKQTTATNNNDADATA